MEKIKFFIKSPDQLSYFMSASYVKKDGSVYINIPHKGYVAKIEKILDKGNESYPDKDFLASKKYDSSKISFHSSGIYKLEHVITKHRKNRTTILGNKLSEIDDTTIMLEMYLPKNLIPYSSEDLPSSNHQLIDIKQLHQDYPNKTIECVILCVGKTKWETKVSKRQSCVSSQQACVTPPSNMP